MSHSRIFPVFPVLFPHRREDIAAYEAAEIPRTVPWDFVAKHREQCLRNHDQTPERLAERGGLAACELVAVVEDRLWREMTDADAGARLREMLAAWERRSE
jgi:hypothetical protein